MKATGVVRRIDDLGRIVIPKEIRRTLHIREGDPLEIYVDDGGQVILKKYSPVQELGDMARKYAESLHATTGLFVLITDRDEVIAVAGLDQEEWMKRPVMAAVDRCIEQRVPRILTAAECREATNREFDQLWGFPVQAVAPIIAAGDPIGSVVLAADDPGTDMGTLELKLVETAARFLGRQMED